MGYPNDWRILLSLVGGVTDAKCLVKDRRVQFNKNVAPKTPTEFTAKSSPALSFFNCHTTVVSTPNFQAEGKV